MKTSRPSRLITTVILLFSMLFMQLAVAAYACPVLLGAASQAMAVEAMSLDQGNNGRDAMNGCLGKDMVQPSLCHAHDHSGNQSLDKPLLPDVVPFIPSALVATLVVLDPADRPAYFSSDSTLLMRTTAPPLSIRNCCFRI
jgi:hypothetical protein